MGEAEFKRDLHRYLQHGRDAILWKLDGASEYDVRRPIVPTGSNLLGLAKHLALVESGYFGATFGRPFPDPLVWDESDPNSDMYASPGETREFITGLYQRACRHADETIESLPLDAPGTVPWWPPERNEATLHRILIHVATETHRHAGQADIIRETIDGSAGLSAESTNLPSDDPEWWATYRERVETAAREASAER